MDEAEYRAGRERLRAELQSCRDKLAYQEGLRERRRQILQSVRDQLKMLEQAAFMRSQLPYRSDYSTLMDTVASACASSTLCISLPCLTTTKARFSGTGLLGVLVTSVPVQFGLTV
jgi:Tfp pilus assembly protein PilO